MSQLGIKLSLYVVGLALRIQAYQAHPKLSEQTINNLQAWDNWWGLGLSGGGGGGGSPEAAEQASKLHDVLQGVTDSLQ